MLLPLRCPLAATIAFLLCSFANAEVGDPQIRTDHPWYPGELAISSFDRLFETQAEVYTRVTGRTTESEEDKAIASWLWRNTHYWHGEAGRRDLWGQGFAGGRDTRLREYWNGLFAYGFGLCGTTHSQWTAEFQYRLGHGRGRGVGAAGHNAFEVFLKDPAYGSDGKWALLDHDLSTIVYDESGSRLIGLGEMQKDIDRWIDRTFLPDRQRGWLVCGLHPSDGNSYRKYAVAEYLAGYAGPNPMVHLRRGESMRRYFRPGLMDGKTFVFWGRNYNTNGIPGPERSRSWVNQPDKMYRTKTGTSHQDGQVRYANVEYVYRPDFASGDYREGIVREDSSEVIFSFRTPYIIGATPPNDEPWGIYDEGCRNGLTVQGETDCKVSVSTNAGRAWVAEQSLADGVDFTDATKGHDQYWLRLSVGADQLTDAKLEIRTVCQANVAVLPRLKDNGTRISYRAGNETVQSAGPELEVAQTFVHEGEFGKDSVTLRLTPDRPVVGIHAAAHVASGSPPRSDIRYQIETSLDDGESWQPIVSDWTVPRIGDEPKDFWSQSLCYGHAGLQAKAGVPIQIRFSNDGRRAVMRGEAHLIQRTSDPDDVEVTYAWTDSQGSHQASHRFGSTGDWNLETAENVETDWVEFATVR